MLAVAIGMAAVAYAYFTGMLGNQEVPTPVVDFIKSDSDHTVTVSAADIGVVWKDIDITIINGVGVDYLEKTGPVSVGNVINLDGDQSLTGEVTVTFQHVPSNTQVGS